MLNESLLPNNDKTTRHQDLSRPGYQTFQGIPATSFLCEECLDSGWVLLYGDVDMPCPACEGAA